jgi:hypothetical protein
MKQQALARHGIPAHLRNSPEWGDEAVAAVRAQTVPFAVAPRCTLPTLRGVLGPGEPVTVDDIEPSTGSDGYVIPSWRRFSELCEQGIVLEKM